MLDNDAMQDTLAADDGQDTLEADGQDTLIAEEPEGEIVIAIEGEEPEAGDDTEVEAELGEKGINALRAAREAAKQARQEAREAKARIAEIEAAQKPKPAALVRPSLEDCGFNEDIFAEKMAAYVVSQREADAKRAAEDQEAKTREAAYQEKLTRYHSERTKVGVDDDAQAIVVSALTAQQQAALMDASLDPAKVVAALSRTPKILAELAGIKEIHRFTYRLAQIEGKITVTTKTPPPPETRLRGGGATAGAASFAAQLEAAEKRAETTGDRTEIRRIRQQMRDAGAA